MNTCATANHEPNVIDFKFLFYSEDLRRTSCLNAAPLLDTYYVSVGLDSYDYAIEFQVSVSVWDGNATIPLLCSNLLFFPRILIASVA